LVIATLKSKGVNSIGAAGFCWGGESFSLVAKTLLKLEQALIYWTGRINLACSI